MDTGGVQTLIPNLPISPWSTMTWMLDLTQSQTLFTFEFSSTLPNTWSYDHAWSPYPPFCGRLQIWHGEAGWEHQRWIMSESLITWELGYWFVFSFAFVLHLMVMFSPRPLVTLDQLVVLGSTVPDFSVFISYKSPTPLFFSLPVSLENPLLLAQLSNIWILAVPWRVCKMSTTWNNFHCMWLCCIIMQEKVGSFNNIMEFSYIFCKKLQSFSLLFVIAYDRPLIGQVKLVWAPTGKR